MTVYFKAEFVYLSLNSSVAFVQTLYVYIMELYVNQSEF
jgi:hypothetical protein